MNLLTFLVRNSENPYLLLLFKLAHFLILDLIIVFSVVFNQFGDLATEIFIAFLDMISIAYMLIFNRNYLYIIRKFLFAHSTRGLFRNHQPRRFDPFPKPTIIISCNRWLLLEGFFNSKQISEFFMILFLLIIQLRRNLQDSASG